MEAPPQEESRAEVRGHTPVQVDQGQQTDGSGCGEPPVTEQADDLNRGMEQEQGESSGSELKPHSERQEQQVGNVEKTEREVGVKRREVFNNIELRQSLHITPPLGPDFAVFYHRVMEQFQNAVERAVSLAGPRDTIQVELRGESLQNYSSMVIRDGAQNLEEFQQLLERLVQSNLKISAEQSMEVVIQIVKNPTGGMGQKRKLQTLMDSELLKKKARFLYDVCNTDSQMCFSVSLAHLLDPNLNDSQASQQGAEIHARAGFSADEPVTLQDVHRFEKILNCRIVVLYRQERCQKFSKFMTGEFKGGKTLFMLLHNGHYRGIKNLKGFLGYNFACESCCTGYSRKGRHSCPDCCSVCCDPGCPQQPLDLKYCSDCNRTCRSVYCYQKHREPKEQSRKGGTASICERVKKCHQCRFVYDSDKHKCPGKKCNICDIPLPTVPSEGDNASDIHQCYIQKVAAESKHSEKYVFYDFETFPNEKGEHVPFYVSTSTFKGETWHAEGTDCAVKFLRHFRRPYYKGYTFIAHNSKGFDSYLILNPMVEQNLTPSLIVQGSKIILFVDPDFNQKYIDSCSFLPMRLAQLPQALGFENTVKGFFPHNFSSANNLKYIGPYPPPAAYGADQMFVSEREHFLTWYKTVQGAVFDFQKEVRLYCQNDTKILRTACLKFRNQFIEETQVDPFSCVTIASACMKVFRMHFLSENRIAIPSPDDYRTQNKSFSRPAIQWLEWEAHNKNVFIQHALNQGEKHIEKYVVDGYAEVNNTCHAWEFLGCFYHGCPTCYQPEETNPLTRLCFCEMYEKTMKKLQMLQSLGLEVTSLWEHEWVEMKENNQELKIFLERFEQPEPLIPRNALYGGRTSAIRLRYTANENETVSYVDVTSLYPHVMCDPQCFYPLDHPTVLHTNIENPQSYFGLICAKVYPPRGLYFPVLPSRTTKGKLLFTLCRLCGEFNNQMGSCNHSDEERALTGVWVTPEFNKAIELGYLIGKVYEVWHFPEKSNNIFKDYMYKFLKGKQEASGYPSEVQGEECRQKYINDYYEQQGIELDPNKISFNPAKRQIAKLCLNSLWGKFGQRSNLVNSTLIKKPEEFFHYMFSDKYDIRYFTFISDQVALVQWQHNKKYVVPPGKVNVFIAAFTTAYGRLALYEHLHRLQDQVLYHDTDSLVYVSKVGEFKLPTGERLGELKDELDGDSIVEWVSSGPKSYAYKTSSDKVVLKAKGITQNYENRQQVCFDGLRDLVQGYIDHQNPRTDDKIIVSQPSIVRNKKGFALRNATLQKTYRVVYDKRRLLSDGRTLPFGF